jgi:hypothetical protein
MPERVSPDALREIFGERLHGAAAQLVDSGSVTDARVLQGGAVVTGVVGKHRVYIRRVGAAGGAWKIEGECNCSERSPCVHVAAVLIAAERGAGGGISPGTRAGSSAGVGITPGAGVGTGAGLLYLLDVAARGLRISVWVGQSGPRGPAKPGAGATADTVHPFTLRSSLSGADFPRYVDSNDKDILKALNATRAEGSGDLGGAWDLGGESASACTATPPSSWIAAA